MIKVAVCDDDTALLNEIRGFLAKYCAEQNKDIEYTFFCSSLELLAELEKGISYDILFLDIIMPGQNGINTAKEIRKYDDNVKIIFLTSSAEYAVESYTVDAFFYQLKPFSEAKFFELMDLVISKCSRHRENSLILRCKTGITRIELDRLEYCEVIGKNLLFYMENGRIIERVGSMDELCGQLAAYDNFLRPHRSYIVNMEYIRNISGKTICMENQAEIPIPHGKCSEIKTKYLDYAFSRKQTVLI